VFNPGTELAMKAWHSLEAPGVGFQVVGKQNEARINRLDTLIDRLDTLIDRQRDLSDRRHDGERPPRRLVQRCSDYLVNLLNIILLLPLASAIMGVAASLIIDKVRVGLI
jgi:hypothetical protein